MKLSGEFVVRQVMDDIVAIPVGKTALQLNGMILLNDVSRIIWTCLEQGTTLEDAVKADEIFTILMGEQVEPRKEWIEKSAKYAINIDI